MELSLSGFVLIFYMLVLLGLGLYAARSASSGESFLIADRKLGPIIAGLAYAASSSSAWVLLGFTAFVASAGVSALWMVPGILAGYAAVWFGIGPYLRQAAKRERWVSAVDILVSGCGVRETRLLRPIAAFIIAVCFVFYIAAQLQASGVALSDVFAIRVNVAIVVSVIVVLLYTFLGGFLAVSLTDMVQGLSIAVVALVLPFAVLAANGGVDVVSAKIASDVSTQGASFAGHTGFAAAGFVTGMLSIGFSALGQPHLIAWVMSVKDRRARVAGGAVAIAWAGLVYASMAVIGLAMSGEAASGHGERLLIVAADGAASPLMAAVLVAAVVSAIMSTIDSQLLVASGTISQDIVGARILPNHEVMRIRAIICGLCVLAVVLSFYLPATIFDRVLFAWTALGAAFGPIIVSRALRMSLRPGAAATAMLVGFFAAIVASQLPSNGPGGWLERTVPWLLAGSVLLICRKGRDVTRDEFTC